MNDVERYVTSGYLLEIDATSATVNYWSEPTETWEPLDVSRDFLQSLIDGEQLPLEVGERLGWREMGSEYSDIGYFSVFSVDDDSYEQPN